MSKGKEQTHCFGITKALRQFTVLKSVSIGRNGPRIKIHWSWNIGYTSSVSDTDRKATLGLSIKLTGKLVRISVPKELSLSWLYLAQPRLIAFVCTNKEGGRWIWLALGYSIKHWRFVSEFSTTQWSSAQSCQRQWDQGKEFLNR